MDLGKIIVVASNGINFQKNMYLLVNKGNSYMISKSVKKSWTKVSDLALDNKDYNCTNNSIGEGISR